MIPKILEDVAETIRKKKITISEAVEGEGRGGSLIDWVNIFFQKRLEGLVI
jgi:hypothetical protein